MLVDHLIHVLNMKKGRHHPPKSLCLQCQLQKAYIWGWNFFLIFYYKVIEYNLYDLLGKKNIRRQRYFRKFDWAFKSWWIKFDKRQEWLRQYTAFRTQCHLDISETCLLTFIVIHLHGNVDILGIISVSGWMSADLKLTRWQWNTQLVPGHLVGLQFVLNQGQVLY